MSSPVSQAQVVIDFLKTNYRFDTFSEPRGVMRILQVFFAAWAFMSVRDFTIDVSMTCGANDGANLQVKYPFAIDKQLCSEAKYPQEAPGSPFSNTLKMDSSLGAQMFVITSALAFLYAAFIIVVYIYLDEVYKSKPEFPMADVALTGILAFFWFIGTVSLNSNDNALQGILNPDYMKERCKSESCQPYVSSFTDMKMALLIGALNTFLWVADIWFLYKETIWFQNRNQIANQGMPQQMGVEQQQFQENYNQQTTYDQGYTAPQQPQYDQGFVQQQPQYDQGFTGGYTQQPQY